MVILTREQLEERLAALHRASLEVVRDLSLENVLTKITHLARQQAGARYAALGVVDNNNRLTKFIPDGLTEEEISHIGHPPQGKGLLGALIKERKTIRLADISSDARRYGFPNNHPQMHTFLGVPIILGERLLGLIYLAEKEDDSHFSDIDEHVIEMLAAYAAVAISNALLYQDLMERDRALTQRNEDLALINDMAATLTSSLELDEVLDQTLKRVMDYLEVDSGEIFLTNEGEQFLSLELHRGAAAEAFWTRSRFQVGEGYIGMVAKEGKPFVSQDPRNDMQFIRPAVIEAGFNWIAGIPLMGRGSIVGVLCVASRQAPHLDERRLNLFTSIGTWAGITIENARLHRQSRRLAVLEERERIGMDLHDGIIQSIYSVGLALDFARSSMENNPPQAHEKIQQAIDGLNNTIRDIRSYILDLRPRQFRGEDLMAGLLQLVEEFRINSRTQATLVGPKDGLFGVPTTKATALFHICQEALANIAKHANAKLTSVHLWTTGDRVILEVTDNGKGFDSRMVNQMLGHGLSNMQVRIQKVGGEVEITSDPGHGTTVLAWVPRRD